MNFHVRALLIDINGTVFDHGDAIDGAPKAINRLRDGGYALRFLTNTESKTVEVTLESLRACGLHVEREELFTPVVAAQTLLACSPGARVLPLMSEELRKAFPPSGRTVGAPAATPTHVIVGDCQAVLDYPLLNRAFRAVRAGAELIALQRGALYRTPQGEEFLDTGAIVAALEYGTGRSARLLGKPSSEYFGLAATSTGFSPQETAVIGDDAHGRHGRPEHRGDDRAGAHRQVRGSGRGGRGRRRLAHGGFGGRGARPAAPPGARHPLTCSFTCSICGVG
ncbi:TIGR01458 family HAD-type hydrolase [Streptomyces cinnamoneus]|uniref:TIGR01458 family HAD-type hydrolase n=1 Tax=Streptomyces cinnamoneus TaxID=53446 RepID=UPI0037AC3ABF